MIAPRDKEPSIEQQLKTARKEKARLLQELAELIGQPLNPAVLDREAPLDWSAEAGQLLGAYWRIADTASTLSSGLCVRQVSRFVRELQSEEGLSQEVSQWWVNRY